jgi:hypothetical protein
MLQQLLMKKKLLKHAKIDLANLRFNNQQSKGT